MLDFYGYSRCSTCRKAEKKLKELGYSVRVIEITEKPPSLKQFQEILKSGRYEIRSLLNTAGEVYRQLGLKDKVKAMSEKELLELLSQNGKLVKRPLVSDGKKWSVGFREEDFLDVWG